MPSPECDSAGETCYVQTFQKGVSMTTTILKADRILRVDEVCETIGVSRTTLWRMSRRGEFPRPLRITDYLRGWRASTVAEWLEGRQAA